jgi:folate-binding protein YgfZ
MDVRRIDLGKPTLLEFRGPDAARFLNGQLTQDVRLVAGAKAALPSCVTDAKGRLQFRVWIMESGDGAFLVSCPAEFSGGLETRLTRYLIADDVEVSDRTGQWSLVHVTGEVPPPARVEARTCGRYGVAGTDWWLPSGTVADIPRDVAKLEGDALEAFRIANGVPAWGRELTEGLLPPEAGLDATDISYQKGCYIGQEVISRIKSAGRINRRLVRFQIDGDVPVENLRLVQENGDPAGEATSVSPLVENGLRHAMGYLKRGVEGFFILTQDGNRHEARIC